MSYNLVTKTGANTVHGTYMFTGTRPNWISDNISPELHKDLIEQIPPKVLAANPDIKPGQDILRMWDTAGTVSGPVVRDRLWYVLSGKWGVFDRHNLGNYNLDGTQSIDDNWLRDWTAKVSWQMSRKDQLSYLYYMNNKGQPHRGGGASTDFSDDRARYRNDKYPYLNQVKWTSTLSSRAVLTVAGSLMKGVDKFLPVEGVQNGDVPRFDSVLRTFDTAQIVYYLNPMYRGVLYTNIGYELANHSLSAGYAFNRAYFGNTEVFSTSNYPAGLRAVFRNGVPDSVNTTNSPVEYHQYMQEHALFVQDKWRPNAKLTVSLGARVEHVYGWEPAACQPETIFIKGQCFPDIKGAPNFTTLSPRLSAIYDLFGNGRTAIKVSGNQYQNAIGTTYLDRINPIRKATDTRPWIDRNGDLLPQLNELGASTGFNLGTTNRYDSSVSRPHTNEYAVELEQQLAGADELPVAHVNRAHGADLERLHDLGIAGGDDLARCDCDHVDPTDERPGHGQHHEDAGPEQQPAKPRARRLLDDLLRGGQEFVLGARLGLGRALILVAPTKLEHRPVPFQGRHPAHAAAPVTPICLT